MADTNSTAAVSVKRTHDIGARVLGTCGPGTVTAHTTMFGAPFEWVDFDWSPGEGKPCPAADLSPLANYADMGGEACRFDALAGQWVRL